MRCMPGGRRVGRVEQAAQDSSSSERLLPPPHEPADVSLAPVGTARGQIAAGSSSPGSGPPAGRVGLDMIVVRDESFHPCLLCDAQFPSMVALRAHVSEEHHSGEHSSSQDRRHRSSGAPTLTKDAERDESPVNRERPAYHCPHCDALFAQRSYLSSHMAQAHEQGKLFVCGICNATFGRKNNMHRHIQTVHEKQRPYQCKWCGMCFGEKGNLLTHARRKHEQHFDERL